MRRKLMGKIENLRWWIAGLLLAATALNYLDRQNFPVVVTELQKHIALTDQQYSNLQSLFLLAYGLMYMGGGRIVDWLGTRTGYAVMIFWWSFANLMHGFVSTVLGLGIFRFLLGLGEGGGFPASAKAVSEWFPVKERSFAFGIFNTGSSIGAVVAPPMITLIVLWLNWHWVFFVTGLMGFAWIFFWLLLYDRPEKHKRCTEAEREYLRSELPAATGDAPRTRWADLFRYRQIWGLVIAKFLSDAAWYVFIFWLPKYLADVRHLNIKEIGYYAWIPYAFAGGGSFIGGWLSSHLIRRHLSVDAARKIALGLSAALMPLSLFIVTSPLAVAILFFGTAMFGHQSWSTIMQTLAADMFPSRMVGSVAGILGAAGSFGGMFLSYLVGGILTRTHSYVPVFLIGGLLHPTSFLLILTIVRRIELVIAQEVSLAAV